MSITPTNLEYGLNNVIDELEKCLGLLYFLQQNDSLQSYPIVEVGAQISIASMQLSALAEDCTDLVVDKELKLPDILSHLPPGTVTPPEQIKYKCKIKKGKKDGNSPQEP